MKILHTSDLHIGKKLIGRERYAEYRAVLSELSVLCKEKAIDLVLVAGDVFDTYTPSAEAEEIFYTGIKQIARYSAVLIISGNHDDPVRLSAASAFAEELNVHIVGNNICPVRCNKFGDTYPVKSGAGWVIFENAEKERVYINTLPYPNEARFKEGKSDESFEEKMSRWISVGEGGRAEKIPVIFLSHIFVAGGSPSESEREIDLGGARVVPLSLLPECDYCALGHLHRRQKLGKNAYYCGAPMQFAFDEAGARKTVNVFELTENGVKNFEEVEIKSGRQLVRLQANSVADGIKLLGNYPQAFVELTLNLNCPISSNESASLHEFENLISLRTEVLTSEADYAVVSNKGKSASELFSDYYNMRYGTEAPDDILALFLSLTEEE